MAVEWGAILAAAGGAVAQALLYYDDVTKLINDVRYDVGKLKNKLAGIKAKYNISAQQYDKLINDVRDSILSIANTGYGKSDSVRELVNKAINNMKSKENELTKKRDDNLMKVEMAIDAENKLDDYLYQPNPFKTKDTLQQGRDLTNKLEEDSKNLNLNKVEDKI